MVSGRDFIEQFREKGGSINTNALLAAIHALPIAKARPIWPIVKKVANDEIAKIDQERDELAGKLDRLNLLISVQKELKAWAASDLRLEPLDTSASHHIQQAMRDGKTAFLKPNVDYSPKAFEECIAQSQCFVVQHNWAQAFQGATDFAAGDFRLPYDNCLFEFRISGRRAAALMTTDADTIFMQLLLQCQNRWAIDDDIARHDNGKWTLYHPGRTQDTNIFESLVVFIGAQVRAISIALDAEVAETEVVRVSEKLCRAREKRGYVVPPPYRIVSLARRTRAAPLVASGEVEHGKVRLHFRRGHWRHFADHKTWIKWMLVGNPELGFVDKEYRL